RSIPWRADGMDSQGGGNRPGDWCPAQSRAAAPVNLIADLVPVPILELVRQAVAAGCYKRGKLLAAWGMLSRKDQTKPRFRQSAEGGFLFAGQALRAREEV